jgi:hypothetical protein
MPVPITHQRDSSTGRSETYLLTSTYKEGSRLIVMTTTCSKCYETGKANWSRGYDDTTVTKYWKGQGWEFHPYNKRAVICPKCSGNLKPTSEESTMARTQAEVHHLAAAAAAGP